MSQIQGLPLQLYPYQGSRQQQQVNTAIAPSSSGMGDGEVIALTGTAALTLLGATWLAATQLGTSSARKSQSRQDPPTPIERTQAQPQPTRAEPTPSKLMLPKSRPTPGSKVRHLPGTVDEFGIYREPQEDLCCGKHALNTVLYALLGESGPYTTEEYKRKTSQSGLSFVDDLKKLVLEKGLFAEEAPRQFSDPEDAQVGALLQSGLNESRGFIFSQPCGNITHYGAGVISSVDGCWHFHDSLTPKRDYTYPGITDAYEALLLFEKERYGGFRNKSHRSFAPEVLVIHTIPDPVIRSNNTPKF